VSITTISAIDAMGLWIGWAC